MNLLFGRASMARTEHQASGRSMTLLDWSRYLEQLDRAHPPGGVAEAWIMFPEDDQPSVDTAFNLGRAIRAITVKAPHFDVRIIGLNHKNQSAVEDGFNTDPPVRAAS